MTLGYAKLAIKANCKETQLTCMSIVKILTITKI